MDHAADTPAWLAALAQSPLGAAMRQSLLLYPTVETLHILGLAFLVGGIAAFDLRVLGVLRGGSVASLARVTLPLAAAGLALAVATGLLLFVTEAPHLAANPAFRAKLVLIGIGFANAAAFHLGPWRHRHRWDTAGSAPLPARIGSAVSLLAWTGALAGGRLIAYL